MGLHLATQRNQSRAISSLLQMKMIQSFSHFVHIQSAPPYVKNDIVSTFYGALRRIWVRVTRSTSDFCLSDNFFPAPKCHVYRQKGHGHRELRARQTRNPRPSNAIDGSSLPRNADLTSSAALFQQPPRKMRNEPPDTRALPSTGAPS